MNKFDIKKTCTCTVQYSAVLYSSIILCNTALYSTEECTIVLCCTVQCSRQYFKLYCVLYCTVQCTVLYCTVYMFPSQAHCYNMQYRIINKHMKYQQSFTLNFQQAKVCRKLRRLTCMWIILMSNFSNNMCISSWMGEQGSCGFYWWAQIRY